jgi:hypothetical protein
MNSKKQIIKDDQINKLFDFLSDAYQKTRRGYTRISMSDVARSNGITTPSKVLAAVKNLEIIKHRGGRRHSMWYWGQETPNMNMANKIYNEIQKIATNERIKAETDNKIKMKKLVPIIKPAKMIDVLNSMYEKRGEILPRNTYKQKYGISENGIQALIDLDVLSEHDRAHGLYIWKFGRPDNTLVDLVTSGIQESKKNDGSSDTESKKNDAQQTNLPDATEYKKQQAEKVVNLIKSLNESQFKGSARELLKGSGLGKMYLSVMINKGFVQNISGRKNPIYVAKNVTDEMGEIVVNEVSQIWKNASKAKRSKQKDPVEIVSKSVSTEVTGNTTEVTGNTSLQKAIAKKIQLENELAKLNNYIKAAQEMESLAAELNL